MSKNKNILIPKLRFPEFKECGEWEEKKLGNISFIQMGQSPKSTSYNTNNRGLPLIQGNADIQNRVSVPRQWTDEPTKICEIGDLILTVRAPVGAIAKSNHKACIGRGVCSIKNNKYSKQEFIYQFLLQYENKWESIGQGSTFVAITGNDIKNLEINIPIQKEQQKIASCLSSLDELIEAHRRKLELLKQHKKGLMQNLFPQEGEKVPKLRFKEFENCGEWEEKKLGKVGKFIGGGTPKRSNSNFWRGNIPWISSSDIKENDLHNISISYLINDNAIKQSATKIIPKGSILFVSRVGVGKLAVNKKELCTSQDFTNLVPNKSVINYFIGYYFMSNKNRLLSLVQGTSIQGFSKIDLENLKLSFPKNKKEQQKIASCLSSLDDLIAAQTEKIKQLKQHKKGLMQGLFPINN